MERLEQLSLSDAEPDGYSREGKSKPKADYLTSKSADTSNYIIVETQLPGKIADALIASVSDTRMLSTMQCYSNAALNKAVKALACISESLEDQGCDIYCFVDYSAFANDTLRTCNIYTWTTQQREDYSPDPFVAVAKSSVPQRTGSFIAHTFKEKKKLQNMRISACGEISISNAIAAIFFARHYLSEERLDLTMTPRFGHEGELTIVNIYLTCFVLRPRD